MAMQLRYMGEFLSRGGVTWRVEILQEADTPYGTVGNLTFEADEALTIEWPETSKEAPLCGSTAVIRIESPGDRTYEDLYTIEPGRIRLDVYREGSLYWSGALDPEFYEEPYEKASNYTVTLTFSDFGILERLKYELTGVRTLREITEHALASAKLNFTSIDSTTYCTTFFTDNEQADISSLSIRSDNFIDEEGEKSTLKETMEGILQPLALRMIQRGGKIYIYDLNGLYALAPSREVVWSSDSQTMGVDKVANNVTVTFSPYAADGNLVSEATFTGEYSTDLCNLTNASYGTVEYYSYYPDYGSEHKRGNEWDYNLINFTIFRSRTEGEGLAYLDSSAYYAHILPMVNGPEECDCVAWGFYTGGHGDLKSGFPVPKGNIAHISKGSNTVVMRTNKVFLPKLSAADAAKFYVRVTLDLLLDARYNPFTEPKDGNNEEGNDDTFKAWTGWAFIPVGITLYDADGNPVKHLMNSSIAMSASTGHLAYAKGEWIAGAANYGDAWLEYYNPDDLKEDAGIRGWKANRQCIGRPDDDSRKNLEYGCNNKFYIYDSFKAMPDGEYIPYPPEGGYLEVTVYEGVSCFDYGEDGDFFDTQKWDQKDLYHKIRWFLYKSPKIEVVKANLVFDSADLDDVEYSGYINKAAKDDIPLDTICGTANAVCPTARGILCRASDNEQISKLVRQDVTDHPEKLLIGTLYSQFADRKTKLEGEARLDTGALCTYTEANQEGKKFLLTSERQDCIMDTAEMTIVELRPDEYEGIEEVG